MARLQDPLVIGGMRLRNRLALAPITTNYGGADGEVTPEILGFYRQRARHLGLVIVEATAVLPEGRIVPFSPGLWKDAHIPGMASLVEAIKGAGAAAVVQINHAGARRWPTDGHHRGLSPSGFLLKPEIETVAMSQDDIDEVVAAFADAAARAEAAGFDGVEVHGAHFYLVSQFLSPVSNHRSDRYGGDTRGRAAFAVEIVEAIRARVAPEFPIVFRLNAVERIEGGLTIEDSVEIARLVKAAGADVVHASLVGFSTWQDQNGLRYPITGSILPKEDPAGANAPSAAAIRESLGSPVIAVGKLGDPEAAARVVEAGMADIVAVGRQLIADAEAAGKMLEGRGDLIVRCKECRTCSLTIGRGEPMRCAVAGNPSEAPPGG